MKFETNSNGIIKRNEPRVVGIFIDGVELDRATRRINKKIVWCYSLIHKQKRIIIINHTCFIILSITIS